MDLSLPGDALTASIVDIPSPSGGETRLADEVEKTLRGQGHLSVERDGDAVMARTSRDADRRVVIAGHLDTVPVAENLPSRRDGDRLYGCGSSDMKSGIAVMLRLAATVPEPRHDLTWLFYDNEETDSAHNGLGRVLGNNAEWLQADLAILMEPTANKVEAGCQGTLRVLVVATGKRAHSARSWLGQNAIHEAGEVLTRLSAYQARRVTIDGCEYREGLNAVRIEGGVSGNVVPDRCTIAVNHRFAPDRTEAEALAHVQELLDPFECVLTDSAPAAPPRLGEPAAAEFLAAIGGEPQAKLGWTDVARFASLGIPAVNFGPGDPNLAHTREEYVELPLIGECERMLRGYLTG
ncbi:MAG TPA: succinyl-diaminopimelate desuccinylase [Mycobacteriales bacterium]|nr:succinyl-diaminopimelate desuccinylase [Mycobacteriales bacterium]